MYKQFMMDLEGIKDSSVICADINKYVKRELSEISEVGKKNKLSTTSISNQNRLLEVILKEVSSACRLSGLSEVRTIIILLKLIIETLYIIDNSTNHSAANENSAKSNGRSLMDKYSEKENQKLTEDSKRIMEAGMDEVTTLIYNALLKNNFLMNARFSLSEYFRIYILSFYLNDCYYYSIKDEEINIFEKRWDLNFSLLMEANSHEKKQWWDLCGSFYGIHKEIGESYFRLDSIRLRNSMIETNWLKNFSEYEIELRDLVYQKKILEIQITYKLQNQSLGMNQCLEKAKIELIDEQKTLEKLKFDSSWANLMDMEMFLPSAGNPEQLIRQYRQKADTAFRHASKILHPDRRAQLLDGKALPPEQEEELNKMYNELMTLRENNSLNPIDMLIGDFFSVNKIKRIVAQAEMILKMNGINLPKLKLMIIGESMEEQLKFLLNEHNLLQTELANLQATIQLLFSDTEIYQKEHILEDASLMETVTKKFECEIELNKTEVEKLTEELKELFEDEK